MSALKHLILSIILLFLIDGIVKSQDFIPGFDDSGLLAGLNYTSYATKFADISYKFGYHAGWAYSSYISDELNIFIDGILAYEVSNVRAFTGLGYGSNVVWDNIKLKVLNLKLAVYPYYFPFSSQAFGIYAGFWFGDAYAGFGDDNYAWYIGDPNDISHCLAFSDLESEFFYTIDYGPVIGFSTGTDELKLQFRYYHGFANHLKNFGKYTEEKMKYRSFMLSLYYTFSYYSYY